jgi:hypothetical protein
MKDGEKNMAYTRGTATNIIVGAAALFVTRTGQTIGDSLTSTAAPQLPGTVKNESYKTTLSDRWSAKVTNVGYTSNGLDLTFTPTFGDIQVDQLLDTARLFKSGMTVTLRTSLAEATLENLLLAIAQKSATITPGGVLGAGIASYSDTGTTGGTSTVTVTAEANTASGYVDILSGDLGDYPVERGLIAVGPSLGPVASPNEERIYVAYRAVSVQNVTLSAKRDTATMFDVEFRLLPDAQGAYGKIIDRSFTP